MSESVTDPLDAVSIRAAISRELSEKLRSLKVVAELDSTNSALAAQPSSPAGCSDVLLAEFQTAGRGRRGRSWLAPPGGAICLSLSWTFPQLPRDAGALSLAIGVCVLRALNVHGVKDAQLKWPNDILLAERKLGGILIELRTDPVGPASAIVGIGLNIALGTALLEEISTSGLPATDLRSAGIAASRNAIAASLIEACLRGLMQFERNGLPPFAEEWRLMDALQGRAVTAHRAEGKTHGVARGIDSCGALLIETSQGLKKLVSGDVTVRAVA